MQRELRRPIPDQDRHGRGAMLSSRPLVGERPACLLCALTAAAEAQTRPPVCPRKMVPVPVGALVLTACAESGGGSELPDATWPSRRTDRNQGEHAFCGQPSHWLRTKSWPVPNYGPGPRRYRTIRPVSRWLSRNAGFLHARSAAVCMAPRTRADYAGWRRAPHSGIPANLAVDSSLAATNVVQGFRCNGRPWPPRRHRLGGRLRPSRGSRISVRVRR